MGGGNVSGTAPHLRFHEVARLRECGPIRLGVHLDRSTGQQLSK
jgi:hypothetical protein